MKHSARPESALINFNALPSQYICPVAPANDGSEVFAATGYDGRSYHFSTQFRLPKDLLDDAVKGNWEKRFRFSSPCLQAGCEQWREGKCALSRAIIDDVAERRLEALPIPKCAIREHCLWHDEHGEKSCSVCSYVVTDGEDREVSVVE